MMVEDSNNKQQYKSLRSLSKQGELNPAWKGNDIGYSALHAWIRKHLPQPKDGLCEICHQKKFTLVANITSVYNREFKNWVWSCHSCNFLYDNSAVRGWITRRKKKESYNDHYSAAITS